MKLNIEKLVFEGKGFGRDEKGKPYFVKKSVPGDELEIEITKDKKTFAEGIISKIIRPSDQRITPKCTHFKKCGGCDHQNIAYKNQLKLKEEIFKETLGRAGIETEILPIISGSNQEFYYRNVIRFFFTGNEGKISFAMHDYSNFNKLVPVNSCLLQSQMCNSILESLKNLYNCHSEHCEESIAESLIDPLAKLQDDLSNLWQLRIREGKFTGEFMVEIITKGDNLAYQKELTKLFKDNFPQVKSLYHTISERNDLRGAKRRLLLGSPIIYEKIGKFTYQVSPESFFQTNSLGVRNLYEKIKEFAEIKMGDRILDLYCGTGTIGIYLSTLAKKVIGVEIVQSAINDAKANAKINNVINCEFICADANVFLSSRAIDRPPIGGMNQGERSPYNGTNDSLIQNLNAIIVDPPRDGLDKKIIPIVSGLLTPNSKLIYVSCNPTTFARDIKLFEENGLKLKKVQPIDMFPQTHHIECIGLLKKTKAADRLTNQKAR